MKLTPAYIAKRENGYSVYKDGILKAEGIKYIKDAKELCGDNGWMYVVLRNTGR